MEINQDPTIGNNINQKANYNNIAYNFIQFYYDSLDKNLNNMFDINKNFIYKETSEFCLQGVLTKGGEKIYSKLLELNQRGCQHKINSVDVVTSGSRRLNILVSGQIQLDGFTYSFTEYFHLASSKKENNWWIQADILRTL